MGSCKVNNLKTAKKSAILKPRQLRMISNVFRVIEISLFLVLIFRISSQLPKAVRNSYCYDYFRAISPTMVSPRFVFFIENTIIIMLLAKSGQLSVKTFPRIESGNDFYEEYRSQMWQSANLQEKQSPCKGSLRNEVVCRKETKTYRRSLSDGASGKKSHRALRRSKTENCMQSSSSCARKWLKNSYPEDNMSSEEFRSKVEAFIARQHRLSMEEY